LSAAEDPSGNTTALLPDSFYVYNTPDTGIAAGTTFSHYFYFTPNSLGGPAAGTVLASFQPSLASIADLTLSWYVDGNSVGADDGGNSLLGSLSISQTLSGPLILSLVDGVNYFALVTGTVAAGPKPGDYSYTLTTTPIPPALLLFGSALAGLGLLGRRSRRSAPAPLA
jgi:hypothetical protein